MMRTLAWFGLAIGLLGCSGESEEGGSGGGGAGGAAGSGGSAGSSSEITQFVGVPVTRSATYTNQSKLVIDGVYGDIQVVAGATTDVEVTFTPFNYRPSDQKKQASQEMQESLVVQAYATLDEILVKTTRTGGGDGLGCSIVVKLPAAFAGSLEAINHAQGPQNPGDVELDFVGKATALSLENLGDGECQAVGAATVTATRARCQGSTVIEGVTDDLDVETQGLIDGTAVRVGLTAVSASASGGKLTSQDGDLSLKLPSTGDFTIHAVSAQGGVVSVASPPAGCNVDESSKSDKTLTCGTGGASYALSAGSTQVEASNVDLSFQ